MKTAMVALAVMAGFAGNIHALEAVAQSPVGGGSATSGANLANDAKISAVKVETSVLRQTVTELKGELKHFSDCAATNQLWNGTECVSVSGAAGANGKDGRDGKDAAVPNCTVSQTVVVKNGALACADASSVSGGIKSVRMVQKAGSAECAADEVILGGGCTGGEGGYFPGDTRNFVQVISDCCNSTVNYSVFPITVGGYYASERKFTCNAPYGLESRYYGSVKTVATAICGKIR